VVNVDETGSNYPVDGTEVKSARGAARAENINALRPSSRTALYLLTNTVSLAPSSNSRNRASDEDTQIIRLRARPENSVPECSSSGTVLSASLSESTRTIKGVRFARAVRIDLRTSTAIAAL
jgi:hypothetical protein